jgi:hypothetical protein
MTAVGIDVGIACFAILADDIASTYYSTTSSNMKKPCEERSRRSCAVI